MLPEALFRFPNPRRAAELKAVSLPEPAQHDECSFASSDGLELYYRDYNSADERIPVLCIPGLTRNSRDFEYVAAHLAASRRVIVTDLRGRGKSAYARDPRRYTVAIEAADVFRLMEQAEVGEVILLGTSRGGIVAMSMAATRPDLLRGIILNDVGGEMDAPGLDRILDFVGQETALPDWDAAVRKLKTFHASAFPDVNDARWLTFARALYREENGQIHPDYDPKLADALRDDTLGIRPNGPCVPLWNLFAALESLPTLVLRGENSDLLSVETLKKMHALRPDLASTTVQRCGHAPFLDEPGAITSIDAFLGQIA